MNIRGADIRVGDDLVFNGVPHRVTAIGDFRHPVATKGRTWRIACSRKLEAGVTDSTWLMMIKPGGTYEVAARLGARCGLASPLPSPAVSGGVAGGGRPKLEARPPEAARRRGQSATLVAGPPAALSQV